MEKWKKRMKDLRETLLYIAMGAMIIATGFMAVRGTAAYVTSSRTEEKKVCVVIDAGHGDC